MSDKQHTPQEFKEFAFEVKNLEGRTLEGYASVFNVRDLGGDRVMPGAFRKTLTERGLKVKFLWQHDRFEPLGKILELREDDHGLFMKAVVSETQRGRDALALLRDNAIDAMSIGYDAIPGGTEFVKEDDGESTRLLKELRLWEVSLVTHPMNEDATITALKEQPGATEGKPWNIFEQDGQFCVYKISTQSGKPDGDPLGCHASQEEALEQMRALYANEPEAAEKEMIGDTPHARLGDVLQGSIHKIFTTLTDSWYVEGYMDREERIFLSSLIGDALDILSNGIPAEMASRQVYPFAVMGRALTTEEKAKDWEWLSELKESDVQRIMDRFDQFEEMLQARFVPAPEQEDHDAPPEEAADDTPMDEPAGPEIPPTEERLAAVEELRQEFEQLEV